VRVRFSICTDRNEKRRFHDGVRGASTILCVRIRVYRRTENVRMRHRPRRCTQMQLSPRGWEGKAICVCACICIQRFVVSISRCTSLLCINKRLRIGRSSEKLKTKNEEPHAQQKYCVVNSVPKIRIGMTCHPSARETNNGLRSVRRC